MLKLDPNRWPPKTLITCALWDSPIIVFVFHLNYYDACCEGERLNLIVFFLGYYYYYGNTILLLKTVLFLFSYLTCAGEAELTVGN